MVDSIGADSYRGDMAESRVEAVAGAPSPPLRSIIGRYRGYRIDGPPGIHRGLPSRHLTFIISLADPVDIARMPADSQAPGRFQAFVGGLHASPASIRHDGTQQGISLELTPLGARALLGLPAGELASTVVPLEDVLGTTALGLVDRLATSFGWHERFSALDEALVQRLKEGRGPSRQVAWAWQQLVSTAGAVEVGALASKVGYSRRHLGELFRRELGLPPKVAARVLRFERSRRVLERRDRPSLAAVAALSGYYDQAHLNREWREIAGCAPTTWMAEELPSVQDEPVDLGAC
jgi:AraC-like DNA-binding protein